MIEIRSHHKWVWTKWDLSNKQCGFTQHTMGYNGVSPTFWYLALSENGVYHKVTFFDGKMDDRYDRPLDLGVPNFQTHPASIATPNRCWTGGHLEIMGKTSSNGIILVHVRHLGMKKHHGWNMAVEATFWTDFWVYDCGTHWEQYMVSTSCTNPQKSWELEHKIWKKNVSIFFVIPVYIYICIYTYARSLLEGLKW